MVNVLSLYLDDSGTRHPTRKVGRTAEHGYDWFALGGILVNQANENEVKSAHKEFCSKWKIPDPLHSSETRSQNEGFFWLRSLSSSDQAKFYDELYCFMREVPVVGLACVIDRPGYCSRYLEKYEKEPWSLCKTAFAVVVERAAKFAQMQGQKLKVFPERCNKQEDGLLESYFHELKEKGSPFSTQTSEKYQPLSKDEFKAILYDFKTKNKSSPLAQLADLYLWPICMGGYHRSNRPYSRLMEDNKLIECNITKDEIETLGSKYSCFENVKQKP